MSYPVQLLPVAHSFQLPVLKRHCEILCSERINLNNAVSVYQTSKVCTFSWAYLSIFIVSAFSLLMSSVCCWAGEWGSGAGSVLWRLFPAEHGGSSGLWAVWGAAAGFWLQLCTGSRCTGRASGNTVFKAALTLWPTSSLSAWGENVWNCSQVPYQHIV